MTTEYMIIEVLEDPYDSPFIIKSIKSDIYPREVKDFTLVPGRYRVVQKQNPMFNTVDPWIEVTAKIELGEDGRYHRIPLTTDGKMEFGAGIGFFAAKEHDQTGFDEETKKVTVKAYRKIFVRKGESFTSIIDQRVKAYERKRNSKIETVHGRTFVEGEGWLLPKQLSEHRLKTKP